MKLASIAEVPPVVNTVNVSSVSVLAPISRDLLIRPYFLYVRLLREDVGRCTFASHCAPAFLPDACRHRTLHHCWLRSTGEGESFLPLLLLLSCSPPPPFKVRFSLLTPRFRRAACATSAVGASFHATALTARFLLGLFLFPLVKALLPPSGWQSFTRHLSLHSSPSLCTHEAVSSVRSNAFCVHDIWLLRLLFHFSTAKLRQAVYLKYRLGYLLHKNVGSLPHFSSMAPG